MEHVTKFTRQSVLVVDAEELILTFLTYALTDQGFQVWTCRTGTQAAEILREHGSEFGVALVDVGEGANNVRTIRTCAPHLPCCAMSAVLSGSDEAELRELGVAAILPKPFRLENCLHILRSIALVAK